jgi:hypothetical protein
MRTRLCVTCRRPFEYRSKARYCSDDCRHGTDAGYNRGCDCARCRAAHARNHKRLRCFPNPAQPAVGTHRRIQALARLGWSTAELSRRLGRHRSYALKVLQNSTLEPATVRVFAELYDELSMTWCTAATAGRTAADARRRGWPPPLAWDDDTIDDLAATPAGSADTDADVDPVVVDRILAGEWRLPATRPERAAVIARFRDEGRPLTELEGLTGWNVWRYTDQDRRGVAA